MIRVRYFVYHYYGEVYRNGERVAQADGLFETDVQILTDANLSGMKESIIAKLTEAGFPHQDGDKLMIVSLTLQGRDW